MPKLLNIIQNIVDSSNKKIVDIISIIIITISSSMTLYLFRSTLDIINTPIIKIHSSFIYSIIYLLTLGLFFISMLGDKMNKPSNRPKIFLFTAIIFAFSTYSLLSEIFNYTFTEILDYILSSSEIPTFLIQTNARIFTVFLPLLIVVLVFTKAFKIPFNQLYRKELLEYQIDIFTRNIDKITEQTMDIKLCEDIGTGKAIIVPEKVTMRHKLLDGSSGSGKTALSIRKDLAQIFYKKSYYREELKQLTYEALKDGLCYLKYPITNKHFNENFSMDLIEIYDNKKQDFMEKFKEFIIGVRKSNTLIFSNEFYLKDKTIEIEIPLEKHLDNKLFFKTDVYIDNMIEDTIDISLKIDVNERIEKENYILEIEKKAYTKISKIKTDELDSNGDIIYEDNVEYISKEIGEGINKKSYTEYLNVSIIPLTNISSSYSFKVNLTEKGEGKIIYRNVGVTVIAPDGGLAENTLEIAEQNGIKVYKIDPKSEEIAKGNIAKFNPLLVGTPEKAGDIVSSTLIAMEQTKGKDSNPYFTNASIRAVRNVVILLKVMYPKLNDGANPVLTDVLDMLNNFNLVIPYIEAMEKDSFLKKRWKTVIDYFKSSFYPPQVDDKGKMIIGATIGTKTKKTEEAISGIINQLDNFLGREEIRYIFCDRENSLNFSDVLEKGECIAISTRQSELGDVLGKAFALMIILSIQNAVLGRYSEDEQPEIPYHLFIDEFPFYLNEQTEVFFTFARKYKTACTVAIQNLAQLEKVNPQFREVIFTNCATKLVLPGANVEDREYFCNFFGVKEDFEIMTSINSNPVITENAKYSEAERGGMKEKNKISQQELAELKFKRCYYATTDSKGNNIVGKGYLDFLKLTEHNTIKPKFINFEQFNSLKNTNTEKKKHNTSINKFDDILQDNTNDVINENETLEDIEEFLQNNLELSDSNINLCDMNFDLDAANITFNNLNNYTIEPIFKEECINDYDNNEFIDSAALEINKEKDNNKHYEDGKQVLNIDNIDELGDKLQDITIEGCFKNEC